METEIICTIRFMNFYEAGLSKEREVHLTMTDSSGFWYAFKFKPTEPYFQKIVDAWLNRRELLFKGIVLPTEYPYQIQTLIDIQFIEPIRE